MMMKTSPGTTFEVVQSQIIFGALEVLFNMPAGAAQPQAASFRRRPMEMRQVIVIRFGITCGPVDHQPDPFQFAFGMAQIMLQKDLPPCQPAAPGFRSGRYP